MSLPLVGICFVKTPSAVERWVHPVISGALAVTGRVIRPLADRCAMTVDEPDPRNPSDMDGTCQNCPALAETREQVVHGTAMSGRT